MTTNLHEVVPPFTLIFNIKTDQNPPWKHFDKANNTQLTDVSTDE